MPLHDALQVADYHKVMDPWKPSCLSSNNLLMVLLVLEQLIHGVAWSLDINKIKLKALEGLNCSTGIDWPVKSVWRKALIKNNHVISISWDKNFKLKDISAILTAFTISFCRSNNGKN